MNTIQSNQMFNISNIRKYVVAGKSIFTLQNQSTKKRFTYKFDVSKSDPYKFWVYVLCRVDNQSHDSYHFIGVFSQQYGFNYSYKSRIRIDSKSVLAIQWFCDSVIIGNKTPKNLEFFHSGKCGKCGKLLTVPESIMNGFGPECVKSVEIPSSINKNHNIIAEEIEVNKKQEKVKKQNWVQLSIDWFKKQ